MTRGTDLDRGLEQVGLRRSDRPIFVVGCPRSGTTLLRVMLSAHPRIAIPPETRFLMPAYERRHEFGDLQLSTNRERLARWIIDQPGSRFDQLQLDPEDVVRQIVEGPPTLGSALGTVFQAYAAKFGKQRWGDKRPRYWSFINELDQLFPDAQFIHLVRDPRACAASLQRPPLELDRSGAIRTWIDAVALCRRAGRRLGPSRFHEIHYEAMVVDPEHEMRGLCAFLGEDYAASMIEPESVVSEAVPRRYPHYELISAGVNTGSLELWRERLTPGEIATIQVVARDHLASSGRELVAAGRPPVRLLAPALWRRLRRSQWLPDLARRRTRSVGAPPVAARLTSQQRALAAQPARPAPRHAGRAHQWGRREGH